MNKFKVTFGILILGLVIANQVSMTMDWNLIDHENEKVENDDVDLMGQGGVNDPVRPNPTPPPPPPPTCDPSTGICMGE